MQSGDGGGNGGDGSDEWWLSGSSMFPVGPGCMYFYCIHTYIYATKIFYNTMKYKINGWYF